MRFSVFTPTHNPKFLNETFRSLQKQTFKDWEWVILPNNLKPDGPKMPEFKDARVRVLPEYNGSTRIGDIKAEACSKCSGEFLVELDHDDLLASNALEKLDAAITETDAAFVWCDTANFFPDGKCQLYGQGYGWTAYEAIVDGTKYVTNRSFEVTPSSLRSIHFAPNHFRAWRAETYRAIGGHDRNLNVCDDHDLVVRTYLAGAKFHHIPETLYLYRMHEDGGNSFLLRNQEIQDTNDLMAAKYTHPIIKEWCRRHELPMYDLGGAHGAVPGFQTVDIQGEADVIHDVRTGLPWADSSVGCVRAYDFLEHIPHCGSSVCKHDSGCTVHLMNEIHRVLVPGGMLLSATPSTDGRGAWQDPTHVSGWNTNSFWYYTRAQQQKYVPGITARFQASAVSNCFPSEWHKMHNIVYAFADLVALKGQRQPGLCEI